MIDCVVERKPAPGGVPAASQSRESVDAARASFLFSPSTARAGVTQPSAQENADYTEVVWKTSIK
jgi:hypothetical protein